MANGDSNFVHSSSGEENQKIFFFFFRFLKMSRS
jgi:hypothetical protein